VGAALCVLAFVLSIVVTTADSRRRDSALPAAATAEPTTAGPPTTVDPATTADPTPTAAPTRTVRHVFPVVDEGAVSYGRTHHGYPATDIMARCGATYVAPVSGIVHEVNRVDRYDPAVNDGATRGGLSVSIIGDDGVRYYGSHFQAIEPGIEPKVRVNAGDKVATVGRTGDAGACHVHFGLSPRCADGDWFVRRGVIWPWPYLDSWRAGGDAQPRPEIDEWLAANGCPDAPTVEP